MLNRLTLVKDRIKTDDMARHSLIMVLSSLLAGLFHYLYQLSMGIMLSPENYGVLFSLTSLFTIIGIFSQTFQTSLAKFATKFRAWNELSQIKFLWRFSLKRTLILGVALFLIGVALSPLLSRFLNIDSNWYPAILFSSLLLVFALPVNQGILQGTQRFLPFGLSNALLGFLKLSLAILLVYLGLGINGGLLPFFLSYLIVFLVTLTFLRNLAGVSNEKFEVRGLYSYTSLTFLAIFSFAMLTNVDVVLAKHFLNPDIAGNYSAISVLGRIALYAPLGITLAMFPKTSELFETGGSHGPILRKAILYTLLLGGGVVLLYGLFSQFIVDLVFGGKYLLATPYLFRYGLAMLLFAFSFLLINYFLSLNQTRAAYPALAAMFLQLGLIAFFHASIVQIVNIMLISAIVCLIAMLALYGKTRKSG